MKTHNDKKKLQLAISLNLIKPFYFFKKKKEVFVYVCLFFKNLSYTYLSISHVNILTSFMSFQILVPKKHTIEMFVMVCGSYALKYL